MCYKNDISIQHPLKQTVARMLIHSITFLKIMVPTVSQRNHACNKNLLGIR